MTREGRHWPAALVALLLASAAANVGFMVIATGDPSFVVEKDYYRKALAWDETMAQEARNEALGWSVALAAGGAARGVDLALRIADGGGAPVEGATVSVEALHNARAGHVLGATLAARGGGVYGTVLPIDRAGLWEVRVRVARGGQVFTRVLSQDLAPGPGRAGS